MEERIASKRQKAASYRKAREALRSARLESVADGLPAAEDSADEDVFGEPASPVRRVPSSPQAAGTAAAARRQRLSSLPLIERDSVAASRLARVVVLESSVRRWENAAQREKSKRERAAATLASERRAHAAALAEVRLALTAEQAKRAGLEDEVEGLRAKLSSQQGEVEHLRKLSRQASSSDANSAPSPAPGVGGDAPETTLLLRAELAGCREELSQTRGRLEVATEQLEALGELFKGAVRSGNDDWLADHVDLTRLREEFQVDEENLSACEALLDETTAELEMVRAKLEQSELGRAAMMAHITDLEEELTRKVDEALALQTDLCSARAGAATALETAKGLREDLAAAATQMVVERAAVEHRADEREAQQVEDHSALQSRLQEEQLRCATESGRVAELEALVQRLSDDKMRSEAEMAQLHREWEARRQSLQTEVLALRHTATEFAEQLEFARQRVTEAETAALSQTQLAQQRKASAFLEQFGWQAEKLLAVLDQEQVGPAKTREQQLQQSESGSGRSSPLSFLFSKSPSLSATEQQAATIRHRNRDVTRANLVLALQHSIHELVDITAEGTELAGEEEPLGAFFIILEELLNFGARAKRSWYEARAVEAACFWPFMREVLGRLADSNLESVESLPRIRTQRGRGRAWMRMALMEKKLGVYIQQALTDPTLITNCYHPHAVLRKDEAESLGELCMALSSVNCVLVIKDMDFDYAQRKSVDYGRFLVRHVKRELSELSRQGDP